MIGFLVLLATASLLLLLSYYLYVPLPPNIPHPWEFQCCLAAKRIGSLLCKMSDALGMTSGMEASRRIAGPVYAMLSKPVGSRGLKITNTVLEGVPVRIYSPDDVKNGELLPTIVYFHGGGFCTFSVDTFENVLRTISRETRSVIIAPEYRLAPEHPFPAGLNDCYDVTVHVLKNAADFQGDSSRVAVAGDSAGGNLAAAVAWKLKNSSNLTRLSLQILLYPMLQAFNFRIPSYVHGAPYEPTAKSLFALCWYAYSTGSLKADVKAILANKHVSRKMKSSREAEFVDMEPVSNEDTPKDDASYEGLIERFQTCLTNPEFSPLMAPDCSVFPPTYLLSAEYDILLDENVLFGKRLTEAGVKVHHENVPGGWHGTVSYSRTKVGEKSMADVIQFITSNL